MPPARRSARTASTNAAREAAHPYTRANRQRSPGSARPSASIARPANGKTSLRLTVKAPPSKLRQATLGSQLSPSIPPNPYADNASESDATPQPATRTARATRNPRTVVEPESDEEEEEGDDEDEEGEEDEEDEEEDDVEEEEEAGTGIQEDDDGDGEDGDISPEQMEEDLEAEDEEEDDDMDELQSDHPPPPIIKQERPSGKLKPNLTVTAPPEGPMKSVEEKEMEESDDEEGEELTELDDEEEEEEEEESDEDDERDISRSATPDLSKLTRRQRGAYEEPESNSLMALSNEAQKKKHLTAEEHAMRRAEMARRRKNLSEKRNEEEKMDTINKLLKKPAPKRRTRAEIIAAQQAESMATPGLEEGEEERPDPLFVRWVNSRDGSRIGVPEEWLEAPIGELFVSAAAGGYGGRMIVEEVA